MKRVAANKYEQNSSSCSLGVCNVGYTKCIIELHNVYLYMLLWSWSQSLSQTTFPRSSLQREISVCCLMHSLNSAVFDNCLLCRQTRSAVRVSIQVWGLGCPNPYLHELEVGIAEEEAYNRDMFQSSKHVCCVKLAVTLCIQQHSDCHHAQPLLPFAFHCRTPCV